MANRDAPDPWPQDHGAPPPPEPGRRGGSPPRKPPRSALRWVIVISAVLAAVVAVVLAVVLTSSPSPSGPIASGSPSTATPPATSTGAGSSSPGGPSTPAPSSTGAPPTEPTASPSTGVPLDQFLADCERSLENWQPGAVIYPRRFPVPLGESATYQARIDIRPGAEEQPPPGPGTTVASVQVRCGVGARLVPLGDGVAVDETDWVLRQFDRPGVVEWNWTVRANAPADAQLRLELRPAIAVVDGGYVIPAGEDSRSPTAAFTTDVQVRAGAFARFTAWFDTSWPQLSAIAVAIGAAIAGVLAWLAKQRRQVRALREPDAPQPAAPGGPTAPKSGPGARKGKRKAGSRP